MTLLVIRDLKRFALFLVNTPFLTPLSIRLYTELSLGAISAPGAISALIAVLTLERKALLLTFKRVGSCSFYPYRKIKEKGNADYTPPHGVIRANGVFFEKRQSFPVEKHVSQSALMGMGLEGSMAAH